MRPSMFAIFFMRHRFASLFSNLLSNPTPVFFGERNASFTFVAQMIVFGRCRLRGVMNAAGARFMVMVNARTK